MRIGKVKLLKGGRKGIEVSYLREDKKDCYRFNNEYSVKYHYPITDGIIGSLRGLEVYLRGLMNFGSGTNISVTGVISDCSSHFKLMYEIESVCGLRVGCVTPKVTDGSGYEDFDAVIGVIERLYDFVEDYVERGIDENSVKQYVIEFGDDVISGSEFDKMSDNEKREVMKKVLISSGCIVIDEGDIDFSGSRLGEGISIDKRVTEDFEV